MIAIALGLIAAACFVLPSLLSLAGGKLSGPTRSAAIAVAAGILLVLAFGDLFPEGLELAGKGAIVGFIAGFALLFLVETLTHAHTHHAPDEHVHHHSLRPFIIGLAIHNAADGFALGVSADLSAGSAFAVGLGVVIHQIPVAISLAAVFATAGITRRQGVRTAVLLALVIPVVTAVTLVAPIGSDRTQGVLTSVAGGVLTYMGATHLLPEAQSEHPRALTGVVFAATLIVMTAITLFGLAH